MVLCSVCDPLQRGKGASLINSHKHAIANWFRVLRIKVSGSESATASVALSSAVCNPVLGEEGCLYMEALLIDAYNNAIGWA